VLVAASFLMLIAAAPTLARQPRMENALAALQTAKAELQKASKDKGGHRENAIRLINEAISEVQKGIRYDEQHISPSERKQYRPY
jgi:hypothetical protein